MTTLLLKLFGSPQILLGDDPLIVRPRNSIKARAILYYLAVLGEPVTRERLAGLFWSDWPEQKARAYLRGELHLLGDLKGEYLIDADGRVGLNPDRCQSDVERIDIVANAATPTVEDLHAASRVYAGPLLDGIDSMLEESSPLFLEWLHSERNRCEVQFRQILYRLAAACADEGRLLNVGIDACTRLLADEPEREEVHRLKMRVLALDGQRAAALKQYDECASALMDELGVPPSAETNALYDRILAGDFDRVTAAPEAARPAPSRPSQRRAISSAAARKWRGWSPCLRSPAVRPSSPWWAWGVSARRRWPRRWQMTCARRSPTASCGARRHRRTDGHLAELGRRLRTRPQQDRQPCRARRSHAQPARRQAGTDRARRRRGRPAD